MTNTGEAFAWNRRTASYAWWIVVVMGLALTLSLMDRMIISLMIQPIKHDLKLTNTQISLLQGLAFTLLTSALAPAALQSVCPNEMRGQLFGLYMLVMSTIGYAVGPLSVALITDHVLHNEGRLNVSLALVACL
jgi:MFS family permease